MSHLAEVFCSNTIILPTRHFMDIRQHLIFGLDELCLVGTENNNRCSYIKTKNIVNLVHY